MNTIDKAILANSMDYESYRRLIDALMAEQKTTGSNHSEAMLHYTQLNIARMNRLDKTTRLTDEVVADLQQIQQPQIWLVLTEGWCGDAAQIVPVLQKMADQNNKLELRLILRDENLEVMDAFLTNGARSIPKVIILEADTLDVIGTWGPRPMEIQEIVVNGMRQIRTLESQEEQKIKTNELKAETQRWYAHDKTKSIQEEFLKAVLAASKLALGI